MAHADLTGLIAQIKANTDVEDSALIFINGSAARLQAAIDAATANGATAAELAPVQAEVDAQKQKSTELAAAIQANTPAAG